MIECFRNVTIANEILMTIRAGKKTKNEVSIQEPIGIDKEGNELTFIVYRHRIIYKPCIKNFSEGNYLILIT